MSGKLFAFNVSKKIENVDEKAQDQWVGDQAALANCYRCLCTSIGYGVNSCTTSGPWCYAWGQAGYYVCDNV